MFQVTPQNFTRKILAIMKWTLQFRKKSISSSANKQDSWIPHPRKASGSAERTPFLSARSHFTFTIHTHFTLGRAFWKGRAALSLIRWGMCCCGWADEPELNFLFNLLGFWGFYWKSGFFWLWSNFRNVCCITAFSIQ